MSSEQKEIMNRLRRVEGQVKGLQKMIEEEKDCSDILVQVAAARAAINKVGTMIFETHFRECLDKAMAEDRMDDFIHSFTELMDRYVK
jgi:CsoR family transcriptional regulator, copper-sensing transcriptional repressor